MLSMLFDSLQVGALNLPNRILLAPLTRARAGLDHRPNALMAEYYAQRASGGLLITECTMVAPNTSAFTTEPGIYAPEQIAGWKKVTETVHARGGRIFMQIWHAGRAAHPAMNGGAENVGPSAIAIDSEVHTPQGKLPNAQPRALTLEEIPAVIEAYVQGARNAIEAGFDGVEVHGANGYLIDQFLRDSANQRTDAYGGPLEHRARFLFEVLAAVTAAIGADRVGLRLSPLNSYNGMIDSDPLALIGFLTERLNTFNLAYLHVMRSDFFQKQAADVMTVARAKYKGVLIGNMGYTPAEAEQAISEGKLDAVAFGTAFLANPDLPERIRAGAALNQPNPATFYTPGPEGYTDYPAMATSTAA
jgi:N-ethylmaleimide reductase